MSFPIAAVSYTDCSEYVIYASYYKGKHTSTVSNHLSLFPSLSLSRSPILLLVSSAAYFQLKTSGGGNNHFTLYPTSASLARPFHKANLRISNFNKYSFILIKI